MERKDIVVLSVLGFLGLLSAALGFAAEATRIKESQVQKTPSECIYPSSNPASGLAITAAVVLMVAQIAITVTTGCLCCKRGPHQSCPNWTFALACLVVSWFTFVIAQFIYVIGALINGQRDDDDSAVFGAFYYCTVLKRGYFAFAAILSLATVILGIVFSYAFILAKKNNDSSSGPASNQSGIAMGLPRFPPTNTQDPVFVHEDTFLRRQFT